MHCGSCWLLVNARLITWFPWFFLLTIHAAYPWGVNEICQSGFPYRYAVRLRALSEEFRQLLLQVRANNHPHSPSSFSEYDIRELSCFLYILLQRVTAILYNTTSRTTTLFFSSRSSLNEVMCLGEWLCRLLGVDIYTHRAQIRLPTVGMNSHTELLGVVWYSPT